MACAVAMGVEIFKELAKFSSLEKVFGMLHPHKEQTFSTPGLGADFLPFAHSDDNELVEGVLVFPNGDEGVTTTDNGFVIGVALFCRFRFCILVLMSPTFPEHVVLNKRSSVISQKQI